MNRMRTWSLGAVGVAILVLLAGWFLLVSPTKAKVADLHSQTATQQQANQTLQTQIAQLKAQNKDLPKQEAKLAEIRQHLPSTPALPTYVRTLTLMAHKAGVTLVSITPTVPVPVTVAAPAVVATPSPTASASASSDSATSDTTVTPAVAPTSPLRMIPVTISINGGYYNVVAFLTKLENLKRSILVYNANVLPANAPAAGSTGAAGATGSSAKNKVSAVLSTRIFYSPPVAATAITPTTGGAAAASGSASPATAS
jgi:Tfp pilus assembly protein PilO